MSNLKTTDKSKLKRTKKIIYIRADYNLHYYNGKSKLPHPRDIPTPPGAEEVAWIPQTLFDGISIVYKFYNRITAHNFLNEGGVYSKAKLKVLNKAPS